MSINLNLELTDHCNIRCKMCSQAHRDEAHGVPSRFMTWETWRAALQGLADMPDDVDLCPHWLGEPTLHPRFDRFVEYAFSVNQHNRLFRTFKLHTNGVLFGEERARLLLRLANRADQAPDTFNFIHFSIDAHTAPVYNEVKGADRHPQVYRNIQRFLDLRAEAGATRPYVTLAFVVQPENAHEALPFRDHWLRALLAHGCAVNQSWDWPHEARDTIYFRPLNCADQASADALHAKVCRSLGITERSDARLRHAESF